MGKTRMGKKIAPAPLYRKREPDILQKFREEARLTPEEVRNGGFYSDGYWDMEKLLKAQLNKALSLRLNDDYKPRPKGRYVLGVVDLEGELPSISEAAINMFGPRLLCRSVQQDMFKAGYMKVVEVLGGGE